MTFRARLTLALLVLAAAPLGILGWGVRREMAARLDADAARRVRAVEALVVRQLSERQAADRARLASLAGQLAADNRFRLAMDGHGTAERRWLLDWAPAHMSATGYAVLQVQDSAGRILSSGQFRNDFDRIAPAIWRAIRSSPAMWAVVDTRTPDGTVRALVTGAGFTVRGERYSLVGGAAFDSTQVAALSPDASIAALLVTRDSAADDDASAMASLPYVDEATGRDAGLARVTLRADPGPTEALKAGVVRWLLITLGATLLLAALVAALLGRVMAAPLSRLARRTAELDLDRLDQRFTTGRDDEIGALERTLDALAARLRTSVSRLREAERAAATGDLARQVNHDIKNGLAPIRNVLRHLSQAAEQEPASLAGIFAERRATLDSSVQYLDDLARNYARLSPAMPRGPIDPRPVVLEVARGVSGPTVDVRVPDALPAVRADAVVLRRILDNLVANAVDALEGRPGTVTIGAAAVGSGADQFVRFTVTDTGRGMTREELARAFDDFYTTKAAGTGLGLTVVRRLLTDVGGSVRAGTAPGGGSTFTVDIPAAAASNGTAPILDAP